jgi:hypothetical protein
MDIKASIALVSVQKPVANTPILQSGSANREDSQLPGRQADFPGAILGRSVRHGVLPAQVRQAASGAGQGQEYPEVQGLCRSGVPTGRDQEDHVCRRSGRSAGYLCRTGPDQLQGREGQEGRAVLTAPLLADGAFQEFGRINLENIGQFPDDLEANISRALFQLADVRPVDVRLMGQVLLGQPFCPAVPEQIASKDLAQIHAPKKTCCRLLTHRFKATKVDRRTGGSDEL